MSSPQRKVLKLDKIIVDLDIQPRAKGLDPDHVDDLVAAYRDDTRRPTIPPPTVWNIKGKGELKLSQGFHRLKAAKLAGLKELECDVRIGSEQECAIDALTSNKSHGLKRSNEDKRRAVDLLLKLCPDWSANRIADAAGVHDGLVAERKKSQVPESGTCEPRTVVGKDGKTYTVKPKDDKPKDETKPGKDETKGPKTETTTVVHEPGKLPLREIAGFPAQLADVLQSCNVITLVELDAWKSELPRGAEPNPANLIRAVLNGASVKVDPHWVFQAHDALVEHLTGKKPAKTKKDEPEDEQPPFAALVQDMDEVCKEINRLTIRIKTWEDDPLSYCINFTSLISDLNQVRKFVQQQRPNAPCPYCRATGQVKTRTCENCKGHKYTTQWKANAGKGSVAS